MSDYPNVDAFIRNGYWGPIGSEIYLYPEVIYNQDQPVPSPIILSYGTPEFLRHAFFCEVKAMREQLEAQAKENENCRFLDRNLILGALSTTKLKMIWELQIENTKLRKQLVEWQNKFRQRLFAEDDRIKELEADIIAKNQHLDKKDKEIKEITHQRDVLHKHFGIGLYTPMPEELHILLTQLDNKKAANASTS